MERRCLRTGKEEGLITQKDRTILLLRASYYIKLLFYIAVIFSAIINSSSAQTEPVIVTAVPEGQEEDTLKTPVKVKNSDNFIAEVLDGIDIQYFRGNVKMFHDSVYMFADSAIIKDNKLTAMGEVIIIQEDTINIFADSLKYNADTKLAKLYDRVVLETNQKQLFTNFLIYDLAKKHGNFVDTAILKRKTMTLSSIKGSYNVENKRAFFYDQVVIIDEDFRLTCDSLDYDTDIDRAYFKSPTYITQGTKNIYCEDGYYDLEEKRAFFTDNAIIKDNGQSASADNIMISEADSTMTLKGHAVVLDSTSTASGDEIIFNDKTGDILILGEGRYENEDNTIIGPHILFNEQSEDLLCEGRSTVYSDNGELTADTISYQKHLDEGHAVGSVIWKDTTENRTLLTEALMYKDSAAYIKASVTTIRPLLMQEVDGDTLYVSADTLISAEPNDSLSYLKAVDEVKIFKTDLQAICDSLYYSSIDSTFTLYGAPLCWSDTTQFKGDTILIVLEEDKVSEIIARENAFITTKQLGDYYDQIKGKYIHSYLDSNELKMIHIKGNAEAIYMIKDEEEAYVGPNNTLCSHMTFFFEQSELDSIKFYTQPESKMTPMKMATEADLKLEGFHWETQLRPKSHLGLRKATSSGRLKVESDTPQPDAFESDVLEIINQESPETKTNNSKLPMPQKKKTAHDNSKKIPSNH